MPTTITYPTALLFWLNSYYPNMPAPPNVGEFLDFCKLQGPVHIMVGSADERRPSKELKPHVKPHLLPEDSILRMSDQLQIICPELCFLLAAQSLPIPALVKLACELCAIYMPDSSSPYGQRDRSQITNVARIQDFLKKCGHISGIRKANIAIRYALDRAKSPAEVQLAVRSCLPRRYGGYALEKPELNYNIWLSPESSALLGRDYCCCDMVWPDKMLVVEYDSNLTHLKKDQHYYDQRRKNALVLSGYTVLTVTAEMLKSFPMMERVFMDLRKLLGMQARKEWFDQFVDERWQVAKMFG